MGGAANPAPSKAVCVVGGAEAGWRALDPQASTLMVSPGSRQGAKPRGQALCPASLNKPDPEGQGP